MNFIHGDAENDDTWLQANPFYQEIAAAPESEGYVPSDIQVQILGSSDGDEDPPF